MSGPQKLVTCPTSQSAREKKRVLSRISWRASMLLRELQIFLVFRDFAIGLEIYPASPYPLLNLSQIYLQTKKFLVLLTIKLKMVFLSFFSHMTIWDLFYIRLNRILQWWEYYTPHLTENSFSEGSRAYTLNSELCFPFYRLELFD